MVAWLLIGIGGFAGSIARYGMTRGVQGMLGSPYFPYGTFAVNMAGCLAIGVLLGYTEFRHPLSFNTHRLLVFGILGGFTTFSSFGLDTFVLWRESRHVAAVLNVALQPALGLLAVWAGHSLAKAAWQS